MNQDDLDIIPGRAMKKAMEIETNKKLRETIPNYANGNKQGKKMKNLNRKIH